MRMFLVLFTLSFSVLSIAGNTAADDKTDKSLNALQVKKKSLSNKQKNNTGDLKRNESKSLETSTFKMMKQSENGISHGSKCGTSNTKCDGGTSHGSKCGSCNTKR